MQQVSLSGARVILQLGTSLGDRVGATIEDVDDPTGLAIRQALASPNGGVTLSADHATVTALPVPPPSQAELDQAALRSTVVAQLQALVGVSWTNMTAAQKQTLIVALLYKVGALDKTLTVQPLASWL